MCCNAVNLSKVGTNFSTTESNRFREFCFVLLREIIPFENVISFVTQSSAYPWKLYLRIAMLKVESILLWVDVCDSFRGGK